AGSIVLIEALCGRFAASTPAAERSAPPGHDERFAPVNDDRIMLDAKSAALVGWRGREACLRAFGIPQADGTAEILYRNGTTVRAAISRRARLRGAVLLRTGGRTATGPVCGAARLGDAGCRAERQGKDGRHPKCSA